MPIRKKFLDWEGQKGRGLTGDLDGRIKVTDKKNINKMQILKKASRNLSRNLIYYQKPHQVFEKIAVEVSGKIMGFC